MRQPFSCAHGTTADSPVEVAPRQFSVVSRRALMPVTVRQRSVVATMNLTHKETDMATVTSDIDIDAPISTVYNQWTQFEDFPAFMDGVEEIVQQGDEMLHWKVSIGGAEREFDAR